MASHSYLAKQLFTLGLLAGIIELPDSLLANKLTRTKYYQHWPTNSPQNLAVVNQQLSYAIVRKGFQKWS